MDIYSRRYAAHQDAVGADFLKLAVFYGQSTHILGQNCSFSNLEPSAANDVCLHGQISVIGQILVGHAGKAQVAKGYTVHFFKDKQLTEHREKDSFLKILLRHKLQKTGRMVIAPLAFFEEHSVIRQKALSILRLQRLIHACQIAVQLVFLDFKKNVRIAVFIGLSAAAVHRQNVENKKFPFHIQRDGHGIQIAVGQHIGDALRHIDAFHICGIVAVIFIRKVESVRKMRRTAQLHPPFAFIQV